MRPWLVILIIQVNICLAQDSTWFRLGVLYKITTQDEMIYTGFVRQETKSTVTVEDFKSKQYDVIRKAEIHTYKKVSDSQAYDDIMLGEFDFKRTYLFASSCFLFNESQIYGSNQYLLFDNLDYAFSENVAVSSSAFLFFPLSFGIKTAFAVKDNFYLGSHAFLVGDLYGLTDNYQPIWGWGAFFKATMGSSNRHISLNAGWLGVNTLLFNPLPGRTFDKIPFVSFGAAKRFSTRIAVSGETYFMPLHNMATAGAALKFVALENLCIGLGGIYLFNPELFRTSSSSNFLIPFIGIERTFN